MPLVCLFFACAVAVLQQLRGRVAAVPPRDQLKLRVLGAAGSGVDCDASGSVAGHQRGRLRGLGDTGPAEKGRGSELSLLVAKHC
jgi:hypothetical protein